MDERPRVLVFAYSEMGARCLQLLIGRGQRVVAVYTHRDDPGEELWFSSVAEIAEAHAIPVCREKQLGSPLAVEQLSALAPDLIFSFYYRRLIPEKILSLARLGAFNMHGSLLPKYRGRAPVNWAILCGETETGATLHQMVQRADAGDIVDQEAVSIGPDDTAGMVGARVVDAACRILDRQLDALLDGSAPCMPQDETRATTFGRRTPEDGRFDWSWPARRISALVRAVARPFPGAFSCIEPQRRLYVWRARPLDGSGTPGAVLSDDPLVIACGSGALELLDWEWRPATCRERPQIGDRLRGDECARAPRVRVGRT